MGGAAGGLAAQVDGGAAQHAGRVGRDCVAGGAGPGQHADELAGGGHGGGAEDAAGGEVGAVGGEGGGQGGGGGGGDGGAVDEEFGGER